MLCDGVGSIPPTQTTKYPASWANYLSQSPRQTWRPCIGPIMMNFTRWVSQEYVPKTIPSTSGGRKRLFHRNEEPLNPEFFQLKNGHSMSLYSYLKRQIHKHGHNCRESLIEGALNTKNTESFENALTHLQFDQVLN